MLLDATFVQCQNKKKSTLDIETCCVNEAFVCEQTAGRIISLLLRGAPAFFFSFPPIKVSSTSEVQQISGAAGRDGFLELRFTSNLKSLRAFLSLVFTQGCFVATPD